MKEVIDFEKALSRGFANYKKNGFFLYEGLSDYRIFFRTEYGELDTGLEKWLSYASSKEQEMTDYYIGFPDSDLRLSDEEFFERKITPCVIFESFVWSFAWKVEKIEGEENAFFLYEWFTFSKKANADDLKKDFISLTGENFPEEKSDDNDAYFKKLFDVEKECLETPEKYRKFVLCVSGILNNFISENPNSNIKRFDINGIPFVSNGCLESVILFSEGEFSEGLKKNSLRIASEFDVHGLKKDAFHHYLLSLDKFYISLENDDSCIYSDEIENDKVCGLPPYFENPFKENQDFENFSGQVLKPEMDENESVMTLFTSKKKMHADARIRKGLESGNVNFSEPVYGLVTWKDLFEIASCGKHLVFMIDKSGFQNSVMVFGGGQIDAEELLEVYKEYEKIHDEKSSEILSKIKEKISRAPENYEEDFSDKIDLPENDEKDFPEEIVYDFVLHINDLVSSAGIWHFKDYPDFVPVKKYENLTMKKALEKYIALAESGNPYACHSVAICFENGNGTEKNPEKARSFLEKALEKDFIPAFFHLYEMLPDECEDKKQLLEKAAAEGYPDALKEVYLKKLLQDSGITENSSLEEVSKVADSFLKVIHAYEENGFKSEAGSLWEDLAIIYKKLIKKEEKEMPSYYFSAEDEAFSSAFDCVMNAVNDGIYSALRQLMKYFDPENPLNRARFYVYESELKSEKWLSFVSRYKEAEKKSVIATRRSDAEEIFRNEQLIQWLEKNSRNGELYESERLCEWYLQFGEIGKAFPFIEKAVSLGSSKKLQFMKSVASNFSNESVPDEKVFELFEKNDFLSLEEENLKLKKICFEALWICDFLKAFSEKMDLRTRYGFFKEKKRNEEIKFPKAIEKEAAFQCILKMAEKDSLCKIACAYCYKFGIGTERDEKKALDFGWSSELQEIYDGLDDLEKPYEEGFEEKLNEYNEKLKYKKISAQNNLTPDNGIDVIQYIYDFVTDDEEQERLLLAASKQGEERASFELSKIYGNENGKKYDTHKWFNFISKAVYQGDRFLNDEIIFALSRSVYKNPLGAHYLDFELAERLKRFFSNVEKRDRKKNGSFWRR